MDNFGWLLIELVREQEVRERRLAPHNLPLTSNEPRERRSGVKRALASTLVRLGLRLDPAAGEGLGAFDLSPARPEASPQA